MSVTRATWRKIQGARDFLLPTLFLISVLFLAILSPMARGNSQIYAAAFLAVVSLILAFVVCVTLVPKLLARVRLEFLNNLRFFRFTQRGTLFVLLIFVISFATLNTGNNLLILVLSFLLASMVVSGIVANLVLYGLKISLTVPDAIHAGQKTVFLVTLHNLKKLFPSFALKLKGEPDNSSGGTDFFLKEKIFPYVKAREKVKLSLYCEFGRRGVYSVEGFEVRTTFPFGFFWRGRSLDARGNIVVYPELRDVGHLFLLQAELQGQEGRNRRGWGNELYNIRNYQSGDNARFVHWKSTAKRNRLMIKDFAQEQETPLTVVFSAYLPDDSAPHLEQFEKAVSYVASLAHDCKMKGHDFRFVSGEFTVTVNGQNREYTALMEYLARVQPADRVDFDPEALPVPCVLFSAGNAVAVVGVPRIDYLQF